MLLLDFLPTLVEYLIGGEAEAFERVAVLPRDLCHISVLYHGVSASLRGNHCLELLLRCHLLGIDFFIEAALNLEVVINFGVNPQMGLLERFCADCRCYHGPTRVDPFTHRLLRQG